MNGVEQQISASPLKYSETAEDVLSFLTRANSAGIACALGIITKVTGGSSRAPGGLFAVAASGEMAGYVSNGCIDADVRLQALAALGDGLVRTLVYGLDSPFVDLRLPCGGSVEILIDPQPATGLCQHAMQMLLQRRPVTLRCDRERGFVNDAPARADVFSFSCRPRLRMVVAGRGAGLERVARLVSALDFPAVIATPDAADRDAIGALPGLTCEPLWYPGQIPNVVIDRWTAILLLFHEHDWEAALLAAWLPQDPFYVGALGSKVTHEGRKQALQALGVPQHLIDRVRGPVGLIPAVRNSTYLAISVIAEISAGYIEATRLDARASEDEE